VVERGDAVTAAESKSRVSKFLSIAPKA
jgi:hypothetical protein